MALVHSERHSIRVEATSESQVPQHNQCEVVRRYKISLSTMPPDGSLWIWLFLKMFEIIQLAEISGNAVELTHDVKFKSNQVSKS